MTAEQAAFRVSAHPTATATRTARDDDAAVLSLHGYRPGAYARLFKRPVDVVLSALALLLALPLLLLLGTAILLSLGRPVLFRQARVGKDGRSFTVYKFRTMRHCRRARRDPRWNGPDRRRTHKTDRDPRHTGVGKLLRKTSLDELPQLWNVLRGDMSLIGPRPELVEIVEQYQPWQHHRHVVRPGLTGLWQVTARGGLPMHEVTHIDLVYVEQQSFLTDVRILLRTPGALLVKRSAS